MLSSRVFIFLFFLFFCASCVSESTYMRLKHQYIIKTNENKELKNSLSACQVQNLSISKEKEALRADSKSKDIRSSLEFLYTRKDKVKDKIETFKSKLGSKVRKYEILTDRISQSENDCTNQSSPKYQVFGKITGWDGENPFIYGSAHSDKPNSKGVMYNSPAIIIDPPQNSIHSNVMFNHDGLYFNGRRTATNAFGARISVNIYSLKPKKEPLSCLKLKGLVKKRDKIKHLLKDYLLLVDELKHIDEDISNFENQLKAL